MGDLIDLGKLDVTGMQKRSAQRACLDGDTRMEQQWEMLLAATLHAVAAGHARTALSIAPGSQRCLLRSD